MKVIQLPPKTGKSIMALHWAAKVKGILIVPKESDKHKLNDFVNNMIDCTTCSFVKKDAKNITILTIEEFLEANKFGKYKDSHIIIDDANILLEKLLNINSNNLTITTD